VLKRHGRVLKGSMPVGLAKMAGVAGLRKEAEIRQLPIPYHLSFLFNPGAIRSCSIERMSGQQGQDNPLEENEKGEFLCFAHGV